MAGVTDNVARTLLAGVLAALLALALGMFIVRWVSRDVARLADAARRVGEGDLDTPLDFQRTSELGELAQSFSRMQHKLRTDRLTGLANREAVMQALEGTHGHAPPPRRRAGPGRALRRPRPLQGR